MPNQKEKTSRLKRRKRKNKMADQSTISLSKLKTKMLKIMEMVDVLGKEFLNLPDKIISTETPKTTDMTKKTIDHSNTKFPPTKKRAPESKNDSDMKSMRKQALKNISPGMLKGNKKGK